MKEIVIVTAWQRPAFLQACLDRLAVADDPALNYRICFDRGYAREQTELVRQFTRRVGGRARVVRRISHGYKGNSYNVLHSYKEALAERPGLVHLVEDDILVGRDYFDFHRRAHELVPDAFSVSACRNQQFLAGHDPEPDPAAVWIHGSYQSIGVSFRPEQLRRVLPHVFGPYFANPVRYCRAHFPNSTINPNNAEQDGLLHRLLEHAGQRSVYAAVPRAYHAGFVGYHRKGGMPAGTIRQQADAILTMGADEMNQRAGSYKDHTTVPLDEYRAPVSRVIAWP